MRIVFFGTSEVGLPILKALLENHQVVHVVTSPDAPVGRQQTITPSPVAEFAANAGIPVSKPQSVRNNPEFLNTLRTMNAEIFVVVSYGKILPKELLEIPPLKTINVHFSLLPKYRGAAPIQFALLNGETTTGTTIFILDEQVDHGPVLATAELLISPDDSFATLAPKLSDLSAKLIIDVLPKYQSGEIIPQEQDHDQATFTKLIKKQNGQIDWTKPAEQIYNTWRAFTPWPGIWTTYQKQTLKIVKCRPAPAANIDNAAHTETAGSVIPCGNNTYLELIQVQLAGKNAVSMNDFLNGHKNFKPEDLGQ